jgi:hypothetical protein
MLTRYILTAKLEATDKYTDKQLKEVLCKGDVPTCDLLRENELGEKEYGCTSVKTLIALKAFLNEKISRSLPGAKYDLEVKAGAKFFRQN